MLISERLNYAPSINVALFIVNKTFLGKWVVLDKVFLDSYRNLNSSLRSMLMSTYDVGVLLTIAKLYGGLCWANDDDTYFDEDIEMRLTEKLAPHCEYELNCCRESKGNDIVIIASALHDAFGHSAVVDKWLRVMSLECKHKLIITRSITEKIANKLVNYGASLYQCKSGGMVGIKEIILAAKSAKIIVLHTSPDDIDAVIAARLLKSIGITTVLYNHADHVFTFGISGVDIVCEISFYGLKLSSRTNRVLGKTLFLGIPLDQARCNNTVHGSNVPRNQILKTVISCGTSYKYQPANGYDFNIFINRMLEARNDVQIVLVGPDQKEIWWVDSISRWGERLKFMGIMSADDYTSLLKSADVYVDSHPMSGGTAFPEALLAGVPALGLNVPVQGYTFADELRVDTVNILVERVCALLDKNEAALVDMEHVRVKVASFQAETAFKEKLKKLYAQEFTNDGNTVQLNSLTKTNDLYFHDNWLMQKKIKLIPRAIRELPMGLRFKVLSMIIKYANFISHEELLKALFHAFKMPMRSVRRRCVYKLE